MRSHSTRARQQEGVKGVADRAHGSLHRAAQTIAVEASHKALPGIRAKKSNDAAALLLRIDNSGLKRNARDVAAGVTMSAVEAVVLIAVGTAAAIAWAMFSKPSGG